MAELVGFPLLVLALGAGWVAAVRWLDPTTTPAELAWRRLARLRGLDSPRPLGDRLGRRLPALRRLQGETDLARLLRVAGRPETPAAWLAKTAGAALGALALVLAAGGLAAAGGGAAPSPALALLAAVAAAALSYSRLRRAASERRAALGRAVAESLPLVAVITYHHRVPVAEALNMFARCQRDPALRQALSTGSEATAAARPPAAGSAAVYEDLGAALGVPMFTSLAGAQRMIGERGLGSQEVLTRLAQDTLAARAAEARVSAAQARTLIVVPIGLMIVPVLILVGAPLVDSLGRMFGP